MQGNKARNTLEIRLDLLPLAGLLTGSHCSRLRLRCRRWPASAAAWACLRLGRRVGPRCRAGRARRAPVLLAPTCCCRAGPAYLPLPHPLPLLRACCWATPVLARAHARAAACAAHCWAAPALALLGCAEPLWAANQNPFS